MDSRFRELDEQGFTILQNALSTRRIDEAIATLQKSYEEERQRSPNPAPSERTT